MCRISVHTCHTTSIVQNISRSPEKLGAVCFPIQLSPLLSAKPSWLTCLCHLEWHPGWMAPFLLQPGRQVLIRSGYQTVFPQNLLKTTQGLGKTQAKTALADSRAPSYKILVIPTACIDGIKTPIGARILLD